MTNIVEIGFWRNPGVAEIDSKINPLWYKKYANGKSWVKKMVIGELKKGLTYRRYKGIAACRVCMLPLGTCDLRYDHFLYPEKYEHYIEKHGVEPPKDFVDYLLSKRQVVQEYLKNKEIHYAVFCVAKSA